MTIGKLFPFKDNIKSVLERSLVVYSIRCLDCKSVDPKEIEREEKTGNKKVFEYIGKTERILCHRLREHSENKKSALKEHADEKKHTIDYENVKILDSADNDTKLRIKELLHILTRRPELNKQLGTQSSYEIKTKIIQAYPQFRSG